MLQARVAFGRALRDRSDRRADGLLRAGPSRRIFLQQHFGQGDDLDVLPAQLLSQGLLNLLDLLFARPDSYIPADVSVAARGDPLPGHSDVRAALLAGSILVLDDKCDDSPYPTGDDDRSAAEPGNDRALIGILDNFPQPEKHFLKTARAKDNPIAIFHLRQIPNSGDRGPCMRREPPRPSGS